MAGKHRIKIILREQTDRFRVFIEDFPKIFYIAFHTFLRARVAVIVRIELAMHITKTLLVKSAASLRVELRVLFLSLLFTSATVLDRMILGMIAATKLVAAASIQPSTELRITAFWTSVRTRIAVSIVVVRWIRIAEVRDELIRDVRDLTIRDFILEELT